MKCTSKHIFKTGNTAYTHDCDDTTVVKGHLIEILNNDKTYVEGETVVYFANSLHEPACEVDSEYYVIFKSKKMELYENTKPYLDAII
jgi:hypothetical protein